MLPIHATQADCIKVRDQLLEWAASNKAIKKDGTVRTIS